MSREPAGTRAVVVTGASSGIGTACARVLARRGFRVFAGYRKDDDGAALARIAGVTPVRLDVTDAASIREAADRIGRELGGESAGVGELARGREPGGADVAPAPIMRLAGLVNNAGIAVGGPLEFLPLDTLRLQLEVNVVGLLGVTQALMPLLRRDRGRIVNMGSIAGLSAVPFLGPYAMSKHALEALTDALRMELRPTGIQVSVIEPGAVATPIWQRSIARADALLETLPPEAERYYGRVMAAVRRRAQESAETGIAAERVAGAVLHALTARRPRTRYLVGRDARIRKLVSRLPDRLSDRLIVGGVKKMLGVS